MGRKRVSTEPKTLREFLLEKFSEAFTVDPKGTIDWKNSRSMPEGGESIVFHNDQPVAYEEILAAAIGFYEQQGFSVRKYTMGGFGTRDGDNSVRNFIITDIEGTVAITVECF